MNRKDFLKNGILSAIGISLMPMNLLAFDQYSQGLEFISLPEAVIQEMHGNLYGLEKKTDLPISKEKIRYNRLVYTSPSPKNKDIQTLEFRSSLLDLKIIRSDQSLMVNGKSIKANQNEVKLDGNKVFVKTISISSHKKKVLLVEQNSLLISMNGSSYLEERQLDLNTAAYFNRARNVRINSISEDLILVLSCA